MSCNAIVVDTETAAQRLGQCEELAKILGARYLSLEELAQNENFSMVVEPLKPRRQKA
jgi:Mg-chelatase subunit ChlD